ncbi:MAG: glycosyltransferase family 4 protein [Dermatophilus congolensis]|nr:glycosyltransferase family 4 protein [Dermatophilus congolensis]
MTRRTATTAAARTVLFAHAGAELYGSDLQMLETVTAFVEDGRRVVVALPNDGPLVPELGARGAEVRIGRFPVIRRSFLSASGLAELGRGAVRAHSDIRMLIKAERPGLVYVNTTVIPWWISAAKLAGIPVLCHLHEAENSDKKALLVALSSPLLMADGLIAISEAAKQAAIDAIPLLASRIHLVHNGVPDRASVPVSPPGGTPYRLCTLGRLSPRKGVHLAVEAARLLAEQGRDIHLEVAGTPFAGYEWYEQELRNTAAVPVLEGRVEFTGYVSPSSVVWDRSDAVIAPSLREPFGNAVVEAQLAQRPVVAVAAAGHLETVKDQVTGLHVQPDAQDIAAKVAWLIDHPADATRIATSARAWARTDFSLERYRAQILQVAAAVGA